MMYGSGHTQTKELTDSALSTLGLPFQALYSTLGRTAARAIETKVYADTMEAWFGQLMANIKARRPQDLQRKALGAAYLAQRRARRRLHGGARVARWPIGW